ncbi:MAG: deoxyribose-phosphate aldolase [Bacteroidetes bacterium GWE2_41_25]|nr:MAG: deoxyribose-phosphate aldolase [Bacteroidetes bacterium GWA2_40_15]OFX91693.1 MAG: deoxyribose-phosphate aldolase [Bacteroidetes bacterium GWE2_41_25]OFX97614.1 MAG: deoxyribose-phosphate aldolase [Bacteroidetes bacterium GWC2_40_22]OFY56938.1 MAG: deoxyribose-phosphate aldolase [Bacteroidetes bacterium GWF2_41_9]HBH83870.1 deoxyribose-phosphate aldolase [Bacteroidales bacterium]
MTKVSELAKMIDHSILNPVMTDNDLKRECDVAKKYDVASVCVKPYAVKQAAELLKGSDVLVGCVIGFPHGNSATSVKVFETEQACRDGAVEIDMVINIGKALQGDWDYVENEIRDVTEASHRHKAIVKVIFETDFVTKDEDKVRLCEICTKVGADFVKTSTGFGYVKQPNGDFNYKGATIHDIELMRKHSGPKVQVKCAGGVRTLDDLLKMKAAGATRSGATATAVMLEEANKRSGE